MSRPPTIPVKQTAAFRVIRGIRGTTPSFLIADGAGELYIVRIGSLPGNGNCIANEWLAYSLARAVGLPVPEAVAVYFSRKFLDQHRGLLDSHNAFEWILQPGLQCGIRFLGDMAGPGRGFTHLNSADLQHVINKTDFAGIHLFDQWAGNPDLLRTTFLRSENTKELHVFFVGDRSHLFGGASWGSFPADFHPDLKFRYFPKLNENATLRWAKKLKFKLPYALSALIPAVPRQWHSGNLATLESTLLWRLDAFSEFNDDPSNALKAYSALSAIRVPSWRIP